MTDRSPVTINKPMTDLICDFTIPGEPTGKGRARITTVNGHARSFTPTKTANYESLIIASYLQERGNNPLITEAVAVLIDCEFAMPMSWSKKKRLAYHSANCTKKPDADNIAKAVCDSLNGVLWRDDAQVASLTVTKRWSGERGSVRVRVFYIE